MELTHHFHVPGDVDETWDHFQDIAGLAGCFPGAQVESAEGDEFTGSCKVKLGPIALLYNGSGHFTERDADAHRMVVEAKGKDKRGNGTAGATATLTMTSSTEGGTDVHVVTELAITGKPAQFGRGLMQEVSDKLLGQFVACLQQQMTPPPDAEPHLAEPQVTEPQVTEAQDTEPQVTEAKYTEAKNTEPRPSAEAPASAKAPAYEPPTDDALNLGATVLPVLIKSYWKPAVVGAAVAALVVWLIRR